MTEKELVRAATTRESSEGLTHATTTEGRTMPNEQGYSADAMCVCGHARGCHIGGSIDCVDCECTIYAKEPIPDGAETEPLATYIREQDEKAFTHLLTEYGNEPTPERYIAVKAAHDRLVGSGTPDASAERAPATGRSEAPK